MTGCARHIPSSVFAGTVTRHADMMPFTVPAAVGRFAAEVDSQVRSVLGDRLVSTILHGSAALGGFVEARSDVDIVMIVADELDPDRVLAVAERVHSVADACPGSGVELSVVTTGAAADPRRPWPYVLHVASTPGDPQTVVGADRDGDPDLLMHYAVCRSAGSAVTGPPPHESIGTIRRDLILGYLATELTWAIAHADTTYAVLNACRAWQFVVTGDLVSKLDGAAWALRIGAPRALVDTAITAQRGTGPAPPPSESQRFVAHVQAVIADTTRR